MNNDIEWKMVKLGDVVEINPSNAILPDEFIYIDLESVEKGTLLYKKLVQKEKAPSRAQRTVIKNDILFQLVRPYQRNNYFYKIEFSTDVIASTGYAVLRQTVCRNDYLYYVIHMGEFVEKVLDKCTGTSYPAITPTSLATISIPIPYKNGTPDLETQSLIAQKLSDMDSLISAKEKLLAKKRNLKTAAMQKLIKDEESENWRKVKLGDCVKFLDNRRIPITENERISGSYPYYGASGIIDYVEKYIFDGEYLLLGEDGANIIDRSTRLAFIVRGKCWINNHAHVMETKKNICIDYLSDYLESLKYDEYNSGTAQPKLNRATCEKIPVILPFTSEGTPDFAEQKRIATILSDMDSEITSIEKEISKLQNLKTAMMQKIFCFTKEDE